MSGLVLGRTLGVPVGQLTLDGAYNANGGKIRLGITSHHGRLYGFGLNGALWCLDPRTQSWVQVSSCVFERSTYLAATGTLSNIYSGVPDTRPDGLGSWAMHAHIVASVVGGAQYPWWIGSLTPSVQFVGPDWAPETGSFGAGLAYAAYKGFAASDETKGTSCPVTVVGSSIEDLLAFVVLFDGQDAPSSAVVTFTIPEMTTEQLPSLGKGNLFPLAGSFVDASVGWIGHTAVIGHSTGVTSVDVRTGVSSTAATALTGVIGAPDTTVTLLSASLQDSALRLEYIASADVERAVEWSDDAAYRGPLTLPRGAWWSLGSHRLRQGRNAIVVRATTVPDGLPFGVRLRAPVPEPTVSEVRLTGAGLASTTAFGSATLVNRHLILASGLASTTTFGSATVGFFNVHEPETTTWASRVVSNGGSAGVDYTEADLTAMDIMAVAYRNAGYTDANARVNVFCGQTLLACRTPMFTGGGPSIEGLLGGAGQEFEAHDYSRRCGLTRRYSSGVTGYGLDTGVAPSSIGTDDSFSLAFYAVTAIKAATTSSTSIDVSMGVITGADTAVLKNNLGVCFRNAGGDLVNGPVSAGQVLPDCTFMCLSRVSSTDLRYFTNGAQTRITTSARSGVRPTGNMYVMAQNNGGNLNSSGHPGTSSGYHMGPGLSPTQVSDLDTAWQSYLTAMGRRPGTYSAALDTWITRVRAQTGTYTYDDLDAINPLVLAYEAVGLNDTNCHLNGLIGHDHLAARVAQFTGTSSGYTTDQWSNLGYRGTAAGYYRESGIVMTSGTTLNNGSPNGVKHGNWNSTVSGTSVSFMILMPSWSSGNAIALGFSGGFYSGIHSYDGVTRNFYAHELNSAAAFGPNNSSTVGVLIGTRDASTATAYLNGVQTGQDTGVAGTFQDGARVGQANTYVGTVAGYHRTRHLTPAEVTSLTSAWQTYRTTLGR